MAGALPPGGGGSGACCLAHMSRQQTSASAQVPATPTAALQLMTRSNSTSASYARSGRRPSPRAYCSASATTAGRCCRLYTGLLSPCLSSSLRGRTHRACVRACVDCGGRRGEAHRGVAARVVCHQSPSCGLGGVGVRGGKRASGRAGASSAPAHGGEGLDASLCRGRHLERDGLGRPLVHARHLHTTRKGGGGKHACTHARHSWGSRGGALSRMRPACFFPPRRPTDQRARARRSNARERARQCVLALLALPGPQQRSTAAPPSPCMHLQQVRELGKAAGADPGQQLGGRGAQDGGRRLQHHLRHTEAARHQGEHQGAGAPGLLTQLLVIQRACAAGPPRAAASRADASKARRLSH